MKMPNCKTFWLLSLLVLMVCGCAATVENSSPDEVKAFFAAANQANYLGMMQMSPQNADLSAYTSYLGVKYPPTDAVEVLSGPPSRPYQAFAVLRGAASGSSSGTVAPADLARLTAKARAIGADAIIIGQGNNSGQRDNSSSAQVEAVAIKYRLENPKEKQGRL